MTNETPQIHAADLHRAVPRQPAEHRHFTPSKTPWSVVGVGIISGFCTVFGIVIALSAWLSLYSGGMATPLTMGPSGLISSIVGMVTGVACFAVGIFGLAGCHVAKAVLDMRDMMRHRGE